MQRHSVAVTKIAALPVDDLVEIPSGERSGMLAEILLATLNHCKDARVSGLMKSALEESTIDDLNSAFDKLKAAKLSDKLGWCCIVEYLLTTTNMVLLRQAIDNSDALAKFSSETPLCTLHNAVSRSPSDPASEKGSTLAYLFARCGNTACFQAELNRGANINLKGNTGSTTYHVCCYYKRKGCVDLCSKNGGDPNIRNEHEESPLDNALHKCNMDILISVLRSQVAVTDETIVKALDGKKDKFLTFAAAKTGDIRILQTILKKSDVNCVATVSELTKANPLHAAAEAGHDTALLTLAEKFPVSLDVATRSGAYPLTLALEHSKSRHTVISVIKLCGIETLKKSAFKKTNFEKEVFEQFRKCTHLHLCAYAGHYDAVKYILDQKLSLQQLTQLNGLEEDPLAAAKKGDNEKVVQLILDALAAFQSGGGGGDKSGENQKLSTSHDGGAATVPVPEGSTVVKPSKAPCNEGPITKTNPYHSLKVKTDLETDSSWGEKSYSEEAVTSDAKSDSCSERKDLFIDDYDSDEYVEYEERRRDGDTDCDCDCNPLASHLKDVFVEGSTRRRPYKNH
eukprot:TRINITY_DN3350_c0_g1_i1.p1 TRINITY_DN3350_c0_g1~~TRINITY_DN3350_c0_g1_i1.p1  ORF type:complete len:587 (+),score=127.69 TRINITY_DN3350_c0_g1_i1:57-1763(+)